MLKHWGIRCVVHVAIMTTLVLIGGGWGGTARAATYYISPTGSNGAAGTSTSTPWKTFAFAIPNLTPGDTLLLMNGTYTASDSGYPTILCGTGGVVSGTASQRITLKAQNERRAFISGNGSAYPLRLLDCAYWTIYGLRIESADNASSSVPNGHAVFINDSNNINFQRNLVRFNNRMENGSIVSFNGSSNCLLEENEIYDFHRNGMGAGNGLTFRRNYMNSRGRIDGPGLESTNHDRGDGSYIFYPSNDNLVENNISEGNEHGYQVIADGPATNNRFYGNISLNDLYGGTTTARGSGAGHTPEDNFFVNFVAIGARYVGFNAHTIRNTRCTNCSILGSSESANGLSSDVPGSNPGDGGPYSIFGTNILVWTHTSSGVVITSAINSWSFQSINSFAGNPNYNPATSSNYTGKLSVNPNLGACRVFIPASSPMKGAGQGGADIGANILYRYQNGVLTTTPLWDPCTGAFPCGAIIPGVNDIAGTSCFDVHKRLNVQFNGCSLPAGYGQQANGCALPADDTPQSAAIAAPKNFRIATVD